MTGGDLRENLLALVAPLAVGDEIAAGLRLLDASTELGLRLTFARGAERFAIEVAPASEGAGHVARSAHLAFGYRSSPGPVDAATAAALCRIVAERAAVNEERVLAAIAEAASRAREVDDGTARVREVEVERLLERAGPPGSPIYSLSPYVGCLVGCRFCYAQSRLARVRRLEGRPAVPWGSYVDVRSNAAEVLARELAVLTDSFPVKLCPIVSDPYHAVERRYRLTRRCLETLAAAPTRPTLVLTRAALIERDVDVLCRLPQGYAGMSLPTVDDEVRAHFEPRGASVGERLRVLLTLRAAGVRTFAVVQPVLPGSIEALADALAETVSSVRVDTLTGVEGAAADFADPRYAEAVTPAWQEDRARALGAALAARGVALWPGELPAELGGA
jgi:DNA repair photolyase